MKSSTAFTHLGPDQREDTKWDEDSEDFTTSNGATAPAARDDVRLMPHPCAHGGAAYLSTTFIDNILSTRKLRSSPRSLHSPRRPVKDQSPYHISPTSSGRITRRLFTSLDLR